MDTYQEWQKNLKHYELSAYAANQWWVILLQTSYKRSLREARRYYRNRDGSQRKTIENGMSRVELATFCVIWVQTWGLRYGVSEENLSNRTFEPVSCVHHPPSHDSGQNNTQGYWSIIEGF